MPAVRPAAVAGMFYAAQPAVLRAQIAECLAGAGAQGTADFSSSP